jgi:hypothetical protein
MGSDQFRMIANGVVESDGVGPYGSARLHGFK